MSISKAKRKEAAYHRYLQGRESLENGDITAAIDLFLQSLALDAHFKTYACLHDCYLQLGKHELAADFIKQAYECNDNNDKIAYEYARSLIADGSISEAKQVLEKLLARKPDYKKARAELAGIDKEETQQ